MPQPLDIILWLQVKSHRGRPKVLVSDGYACLNKSCLYHGITDQNIHALVGDGVEGTHEAI